MLALRRRGARRALRIALAVVGVLILAWAVAMYVLVIDPSVQKPAHVDAVVVLGGASVDGRLTRGVELVTEGYASQLVVSHPVSDDTRITHFCDQPLAGVQMSCFVPEPSTTQGEAREIRTLAAQRGWHKIMVVTSQYHIDRARLIIQRCYKGDLLMINAMHPTFGEWAGQLLYQTGAWAKALTVTTSC
jgi:uncharacterized SAM-binding protein YcdF (DUF218 family)